MAAITAALIKQVREETGAGMMDVKKALTEAEGDVARAKEIIRAKGIQAAGKREGRKAQEGTIASTVVDSANGQTGYAVELNSETDFVAKTPKFVDFADTVLAAAVKVNANGIDDVLAAPSDEGTVKESVEEAAALFGEHVKIGQFAKIEGPRVEIYAHKKSAEMPPSIVAMIATDEAGAAVAHEAALQISAMGAQWLSREDVPEDIVESERRVATEKSLAEGKPEKIVPKIVEGRLNAFFKENVLLEQAYVKDSSKTIGDLFKEVGGQALAFARLEVGKGPEADAE
ncbi:translation elongation factor Ts [Bifidobacterium pseudolongum subsp. globosum]|uniref:translation elongation factor Ts n=1 Tax=Bifidobacterium pseudolongum TaxID=1694 RepID=UPI000BA98B57|nr:translation elongation factor Ts [Bifidobacterium pseudolongum]ASW24287.1 translation elongation factor Ts [Bifidobacterium pseudolongum]MCI1194072.1 translation elongation factor Ts [Bifidobacterium pseudolongum subsp. globosum]RYQ07648.1 elongation factor Ts [Bifidobacterium pseudolongum subsp. globosum]UNP93747.1 translation elongation factor Ts [Bifidobacterium pseudolongum subsp. globosum]UNZ10352.1 translation elongation factor Ts [Bifidobacterium pseudolongum subsp. globosum]